MPGADLIDTYVDLRHRCAVIGHGLGQKDHEADGWVAATALWLGLPLVAHDGIFRDVPGLQLIPLAAICAALDCQPGDLLTYEG